MVKRKLKQEALPLRAVGGVRSGQIIRKLSQAEFFRLCEWLRGTTEDDRKLHATELAQKASRELPFEVAPATVVTAASVTGVELTARRPVTRDLERQAAAMFQLEQRIMLLESTVKALEGLVATIRKELGIK